MHNSTDLDLTHSVRPGLNNLCAPHDEAEEEPRDSQIAHMSLIQPPRTPLREAHLADIGAISCTRPDQVAELYEQVMQYFKHGISIHSGATVFDVGANIGLFSLAAQKMCENNVVSYMFEPIPSTFAALEENARRFGAGKLKALCCGLSAHAGTAEFSYCPNMPSLSTAYIDDRSELQAQLKNSILRNLPETRGRVRWIRYLPGFFRSWLLDKALRQMFTTEKVQCTLNTVSKVIAEFDVQRIDLLKVDVEKAELDVLLGIVNGDWPKIHQVVMEVHDIDGRVAAIRQLLTAQGIDKIVIDQETVLRGSNVFNLYARR